MIVSCVGARAPGPLESLKIPSGIKRAAGGGSWPWGKYTHETKIVGPEAGYSMTQKKGYSPFASPQASLPAKRRSSASDPLWRQRLWKLPARALCSPPHGPHQDFGAKPIITTSTKAVQLTSLLPHGVQRSHCVCVPYCGWHCVMGNAVLF